MPSLRLMQDGISSYVLSERQFLHSLSERERSNMTWKRLEMCRFSPIIELIRCNLLEALLWEFVSETNLFYQAEEGRFDGQHFVDGIVVSAVILFPSQALECRDIKSFFYQPFLPVFLYDRFCYLKVQCYRLIFFKLTKLKLTTTLANK